MIIRNPINPYPQNITVDHSKTKIEFTFSGERLRSYKLQIYEYYPTQKSTPDYTEIVNLPDYAFNGERIVHNKVLSLMIENANKSYVWEVIMSPEVTDFEDNEVTDFEDKSQTFTSLKYFFETASNPKITPVIDDSEEDTAGFMVNGKQEEYDQSELNPHIAIENLDTRIINIEGYYKTADIKYYYFELFDEDGNLIQKTNKTFSSKISYNFSGLLPYKKYALNFFAVSQKEQLTNITFDINVTYIPKQNTVFSPALTCDENKSIINIKWPKDMTAAGEANGNWEISNGKVTINSGTIVYDNISSLPIAMDKDKFAIGIKTTVNNNTTKIFNYINNDYIYGVYIKDYKFYLAVIDTSSDSENISEVGNFKTNIEFGVIDNENPSNDTGYMMYNDEEHEIPYSEDKYIVISKDENYAYLILLQKNLDYSITLDRI